MSSARRMLGLLLALLMCSALVQAQTARSTEDPRNQAPTVNGGTGLFTVYDAETLRKGEFNFGFFANHFHRDPGDAAFQVYSTNFQVGFGDRLEFFVNLEAQRVISIGSPILISGFYLPDVRTKTIPQGRLVIVPGQNGISILSGDPCGNGGFPGPCTSGANVRPFTARPSGNDVAVYVGLGAPVGGILPAITPNVTPNYLPSAPFISRFVGAGVGDIWLGGKIRLTSVNNSFGVALIPLFKIPTTRLLSTGLERGRGTGAYDYGVILALDGRLHKYINLSSNIGFIKVGDPRADDMQLGPLAAPAGVVQGFGSSDKALDLPNEFRSGLGIDLPLTQYFQLIGELRSTYYVGSRTPSLLRNSPVDVIAGARIFPTRAISISAAYQRHLNWFSDLDKRHGPNGFILGVSVGRANKREEPIVPNQPPTVSLEVGAVTAVATNVQRASSSTICAGDRVALRANASDPDGDTLLYSWTSTGGRIVGDGANTSLDTAGLAPGDYTITVNVDDGCGCVAFDTKTVRVANCPPPPPPPPPPIECFNSNLDVTASSQTVQPGEAVRLSTPGVSGGRGYGNVTYNWTASAGTITGSGTTARLDTTGVSPGSNIQVRVTASSSEGNCTASGSVGGAGGGIRVSSPPPPPPRAVPTPSELTPCNTFKKNNARVDNACKDILGTAARRMQSDPQAQLYVDSYRGAKEIPKTLDKQRGQNVRDRLADGSVGVTVDPNRITVRPSGVATDGSQVKLYFVPSGATAPPGAAPATLGPVKPTKKAPARKSGAAKSTAAKSKPAAAKGKKPAAKKK